MNVYIRIPLHFAFISEITHKIFWDTECIFHRIHDPVTKRNCITTYLTKKSGGRWGGRNDREGGVKGTGVVVEVREVGAEVKRNRSCFWV
jgi:hypothetical protein